jgi:hypothetical protein
VKAGRIVCKGALAPLRTLAYVWQGDRQGCGLLSGAKILGVHSEGEAGFANVCTRIEHDWLADASFQGCTNSEDGNIETEKARRLET